MRIKLFLLASVFIFTACEKGGNLLLLSSGNEVPIKAEIADSEEERRLGLMNRTELADGKGMWFIFEDSSPRSFWMKNTLIPLDIIFFNSEKEVVKIIENMLPCKEDPCPSYSSVAPAMYALELPAGFVQEYSIKPGDRIVEK